MAKKIEEVNALRQEFEDYFKEDLDAIEQELQKSMSYSEIIDKEIFKLSENKIGTTQGSQKYLIEHITNAVQLQTQRQGLRRDKFNIKKIIMDYASKFTDNTDNSKGNLEELLNKLLQQDKENRKSEVINPSISDEELDNEIDNILNENTGE